MSLLITNRGCYISAWRRCRRSVVHVVRDVPIMNAYDRREMRSCYFVLTLWAVVLAVIAWAEYGA